MCPLLLTHHRCSFTWEHIKRLFMTWGMPSCPQEGWMWCPINWFMAGSRGWCAGTGKVDIFLCFGQTASVQITWKHCFSALFKSLIKRTRGWLCDRELRRWEDSYLQLNVSKTKDVSIDLGKIPTVMTVSLSKVRIWSSSHRKNTSVNNNWLGSEFWSKKNL